MNDKIKNIVVTISFLLVIIMVLLINIITKDVAISLTERRKLQQFPKISIATLFDGSFLKSLKNIQWISFLKEKHLES